MIGRSQFKGIHNLKALPPTNIARGTSPLFRGEDVMPSTDKHEDSPCWEESVGVVHSIIQKVNTKAQEKGIPRPPYLSSLKIKMST